MADEVLFRVASTITGQRRGRRGAPLDVDYLLRETPWMERSGRWARAADGAWTLDRAAERDDLAEWDREFGGMATLGSKRVRLLVPAAEKERPSSSVWPLNWIWRWGRWPPGCRSSSPRRVSPP